MMEAATLGGIQQKMIEALGELVQVLPSSHMPVEASLRQDPLGSSAGRDEPGMTEGTN
jgi:hypothetical protein